MSYINRDDLEALVDEKGLDGVLDMLVEICHEKADHVQTNWQDTVLARAWTRNAKRIETARTGIEEVT